MNFAAPAAGLLAACLDEILEALQVILNAPLQQAHRIAGALDRTLRFLFQSQRDARGVGAELQEGNRATIGRARGAPPDHGLVRPLFYDFSVPFLALTGDCGAPVQASIVALTNLLHTLHKLREALELCPLIVRGSY